MTSDDNSDEMAYAYPDFMTGMEIGMNIPDINGFDLDEFDNFNIYSDLDPDPATIAAQGPSQTGTLSQYIQHQQPSLQLDPTLQPSSPNLPLHNVSSDFTHLLIDPAQSARTYRFREQKPKKSRGQVQVLPTPQSSTESNPERRTGMYVSPLAFGERQEGQGLVTMDGNTTNSSGLSSAYQALQQQQQQQQLHLLSDLEPLTSPVLNNGTSTNSTGTPPLQHLLSGRKPSPTGKSGKKTRANPSPRLGVSGGGIASSSKRAGLGKRTMSAPSLGGKSPPSGDIAVIKANTLPTPALIPIGQTGSVGAPFSVAPVTPGSLMKIAIASKPPPQAFLPSIMAMQSSLVKPFLPPTQPEINMAMNAPTVGSKTSPVALKPLISPSLKPLLPGVSCAEAAERLATKSNYQNILEGDTTSLGLSYSTDIHSGIELRRTSHKAAEQKRRDSLKGCFDDLRRLVPSVTERNPSKVYLLQKSHTYIKSLRTDNGIKDQRIAALRQEVRELKLKLGVPLTAEDEEEEVRPEEISDEDGSHEGRERTSDGDELDDELDEEEYDYSM